MTKLNLLGAQRVKALSDILERRFKDAINEAEKRYKRNREDVLKEMAKEVGVEKEFEEYEQMKDRLMELNKVLAPIGVDASINNKSYRINGEIHRRMNEEYDKVKRRLQRELSERNSSLWLVETLEQAQEIVNKEITI